jgi:hypothetical protein
MSAELTKLHTDIISSLVINGDLSKLTQAQKLEYYSKVCERVGLDPMAQPFKLLKLNGKEVMYLDRSGAQQLNSLHKVSHLISSRELIAEAGVYQVTARASQPDGRFTESIGAVNIGGLKGDSYANAIMKAETKAKRRATLDLLGLGMLDETEVETIPGAEVVEEPATISQINHIENLLHNSSIDEKQKQKIELELASLTSVRAEKCIAYLKDNQIEFDLNKQLDKLIERED